MSALSNAVSVTPPDAPLRRFPIQMLSSYLKGGHRAVQGWLTPLSAQVIAFLLNEQTGMAIRGAVGEIGVHHGKLFLVEYLSTQNDERAFAVDVFEQQELNLDHSGKGDRERFLDNIKAHAGSSDGLIIIASDSLKLTPEQILSQAGPARFVSVDGGHTEECTRSDLRLAEACLADGGIVLLDDYFNHHWPDVSVGAASHFLSPGAKTKPFLVTPNKVFFAEEQYHPIYQKAVRAAFTSHYTRRCKMFGTTVDIYLLEGVRSLSRSVGGLIADEARIRLAGHPRLTEFVKACAGALLPLGLS